MWLILHSLFIFFSCVLIMLPYDAPAVASIFLFLAGLFIALLIAGRAYIPNIKHALVIPTIILGSLALLIVYLCLEYPAIVIALSVLDVFFILQVIFWPVALRPILIGYNTYNNIGSKYYVFALSVIVAILSLLTGYPILYGALYVLFCVVMERQLGRIHG